MYPSVGDFSRPDSAAQTSSSQSQGTPRWPPPQLEGLQQNGPSSGLLSPQNSNASAAQNFPLLRVHIADQYRTFPPVMMNSALEEIPRSSFTFDFAYEQQLIRRLQSASQSSTSEGLQMDHSQTVVNRFTQLGFPRELVVLALAGTGGSDSVDDDKVVEFCKNLKALKSMGFDSATVVGALVLHKSDLQAATDACLAAEN